VGPLRVRTQDLRARSLLVLLRSRGLLRDFSGPVQALNPACRAARRYPTLPAARLLIKLQDADVSSRVAAHLQASLSPGLQGLAAERLVALCFSGPPYALGLLLLDLLAALGLAAVGVPLFLLFQAWPGLTGIALAAVALLALLLRLGWTSAARWPSVLLPARKPPSSAVYEEFFRRGEAKDPGDEDDLDLGQDWDFAALAKVQAPRPGPAGSHTQGPRRGRNRLKPTAKPGPRAFVYSGPKKPNPGPYPNSGPGSYNPNLSPGSIP
jgi:hypothetical protein